ncbi:DUF2147 domain-containing protein [Acetobacteraceae bacterium ESL0709]|nr:DUF2147 domain-containing protein [Acetobacteraceae bacterium ESL0697]MDF7678290.1 DUF2147 domain-containing protein [Acetobacteraceae bacterium ESL0709]
MLFCAEKKARGVGTVLSRFCLGVFLGLSVLVGSFSCGGVASAAPSVIPEEGYWLVESKDGIFYLAPCDPRVKPEEMRLCGWLVGLDYTGAKAPVDHWGRSQCGLTMMQNMTRDDEGAWHGDILDPRTGRQYGARVKLGADGILRLHGFMILPFFGQTQEWTRYNGPPIGPQCRMVMEKQ